MNTPSVDNPCDPAAGHTWGHRVVPTGVLTDWWLGSTRLSVENSFDAHCWLTIRGYKNAYYKTRSVMKVPRDLSLSDVWPRSVGYQTLLAEGRWRGEHVVPGNLGVAQEV